MPFVCSHVAACQQQVSALGGGLGQHKLVTVRMISAVLISVWMLIASCVASHSAVADAAEVSVCLT
jgi:hypothetical protein